MLMRRAVTPAVILAIFLVVLAVGLEWTRAQVLIPRPDEVRFQLITNEPVAAPDRRAVIPGWSAQVIKDWQTSQCFVAISANREIAISPVACPPER
jgi:hypothetical protein